MQLFPSVADAMSIKSAAIVEKDYYIVELLRLLQPSPLSPARRLKSIF